MDFHCILRQLIYVPQLTDGRKTFLHFYWNGKAYSLREYADPHVPPRPRYREEVGLSVEEIWRLAHARGSFCVDAPNQDKDSVAFWYAKIQEANWKYLHVGSAKPVDLPAVPVPAPRPAPPHARPPGPPPAGYPGSLLTGFWRYRAEHYEGAGELFDPQYGPGTQPPVFAVEPRAPEPDIPAGCRAG